MRDRLIELMKKADGYASGVCTDYDEAQEVCADFLLAEGVIAPPVKVGQTVYKITRKKVKECEVVYIGISKDESMGSFNIVENYSDGTFYKSYSFPYWVIGKSIFLTREDAERALKGENNG